MRKGYVWKNKAGWCALQFTDKGVARFEFGFGSRAEAESRFCADVERIKISARLPEKIKEAVTQIDGYFEGRLKRFDVALDFGVATEFQKKVWRAAMKVLYGKTASYADIAAAAGCPGGARAAGNALGANPFPVIVPCHRVLKSGGGLGGFSIGFDVKRALLALERGETADFAAARFVRNGG